MLIFDRENVAFVAGFPFLTISNEFKGLFHFTNAIFLKNWGENLYFETLFTVINVFHERAIRETVTTYSNNKKSHAIRYKIHIYIYVFPDQVHAHALGLYLIQLYIMWYGRKTPHHI